MLSERERTATADTIESVQCEDGFIPWHHGRHGDPWNHVEAAMALAACGRPHAARRAYEWLATTQRPDGAWHQYYLGGGEVEVPLLDANVCAYVATGSLHHWLTTGDVAFLRSMWPVVEAAIEFAIGLQRPGGEIAWARHPDGTAWPFALLTASASTCHSIGSALFVASVLGHDRPGWARARDRLAHAIAHRPWSFLPKDRWAMDWYYPVLSGVIGGADARSRLSQGRERFVMGGLGTRCVSDRPWVTAAETAECALAYLAAGRHGDALDLLAWTRHLRDDDGSYATGIVHPQGDEFPRDERCTYSAAAVLLADRALADPSSPASILFACQPEGAGGVAR